jgi:hypothetical protein
LLGFFVVAGKNIGHFICFFSVSTLSAIKPNKYKDFKTAYPEILLDFIWMHPFCDDFFRRIDSL